ncbi:MAG: hypothetical protein HS111_12730 [Kofleriaceae bacterium]|nr:hypothetical protein [Kofleriaceae bacterium]
MTFPDVVVGDVARMPAWVFNVHSSAPVSLQVQLQVGRERPTDLPPFQVVSAPSRLRPSREGAGEPIVVAFTSSRRADYEGRLVVVASWPWGAATEPQRVEIRLRGWTRAEGEPLRAGVLAAEAGRQAAARAARDQAAREAAQWRRFEQESDAPYPQSKANKLDDQAGRALDQLDSLTRAQFAAINAVKEETVRFKRRRPPATHVFARALARFALDVATAGIAARVAAGVVRAFSTRVKYVRPGAMAERWNVHGQWRYEWVPVAGPPRRVTLPALLSPDGLAALDEMVQATVSGTLLPATSELLGDGPANRHSPSPDGRAGRSTISSVAEIQFFYDQTVEVNNELDRRRASLRSLHALLKPSLRREADAAITAMHALRTSLESEVEHAATIQACQTRQSWMSFLSQSSVGWLSPPELRQRGLRLIDDAVSVTDAARLANPTSRGQVPPYDGVLDVYLRANRYRPRDAIRIERVHMNGVIKAMLDECLRRAGLVRGRDLARFGDLRIVLRAIAVASGVEDFGVVVTRDEAGNVFSSDTTGALPEGSTWLARRAGHDRTSPGLQQEGAVHLMNEILRSDIAARIATSTDEA